MWRLGLLTYLAVFSATGICQVARGSLSGTVLGPDGATVAAAPIQAKDRESGAIARTMSSGTGRFALPDLPAGTYQVSIAMPGPFRPFKKNDVIIQAGQTLQLDIRLEQGAGLNTLADDPATEAAILRNRAVIPNRPVPRTRDGRPDLSGLWIIAFNDRGWVGIYPRTEQLHMTERYRRPDFGHLEVRVTFEDPGVFMHVHVRRDRQHAKFCCHLSNSRGIMGSARES